MTEEKTNGHAIPENEKPQEDLAAEFAALGKKLGEAISAAWQSEERHKLQADLKDGLERFSAEVDKAVKDLRQSEVGQKVQTGVQDVAEDVKSGKVGEEVRKGMVTALRSLSEALDRMANTFTPHEEGPKE